MTIQAVVTHSPFVVRRRTAGDSFDLIARQETMSQTLLIPGLSRLNPNKLFAQGQPGGWADPYDLTRMWVDDAGTTPATIASLGTGIGRVITKGNAITLTQANAADRPVWGRHPVSGIRNLLSNTDTLSTQSVTVAAVQKTLSFRGTGTITLSGASTAGPLVGTGANNIVSLTFTPSAGSLTLTVSGTVEIAQLEAGATRTPYQRVTNRFDITETGVPSLYYFSFNGVNQSWSSNATVDFSSVDKMTLWLGMAKLSDAARATLLELGTGGAGALFAFESPPGANANITVISRGTGSSVTQSLLRAAPTAALGVVAEANISGPLLRLTDQSGTTQTTVTQGAGNYINATLHVGRRTGNSQPFNGRIYNLIVAGDNYDSRTIQRFSDWTLKPRRLITA